MTFNARFSWFTLMTVEEKTCDRSNFRHEKLKRVTATFARDICPEGSSYIIFQVISYPAPTINTHYNICLSELLYFNLSHQTDLMLYPAIYLLLQHDLGCASRCITWLIILRGSDQVSRSSTLKISSCFRS